MNGKQRNNSVAIVAMIFLFGMIAFVTNLAAPIGVIWKNQPALGGSNFLGMLGNMMNFLAYLFMGIPAGKLIMKIGYKKTTLLAIAIGFVGVFIQYLSGIVGVTSTLFGLPTNFFVYLLGAFVTGFAPCILNAVANPMLNLLGGGGNRGNQLIQIGGSFNSLTATITPMFVATLIGIVTPQTAIADVNIVLYIAMGVFAASFVLLSFAPIEDPEQHTAVSSDDKYSAWSFRHFVLGVVAIFVYIGVEVGIPGTLLFYLSDTTEAGAGLSPEIAVTIAGFVAGTYWFLMLIGRLIGSVISGKFSSRAMITTVSLSAIVFVLAAMFMPKEALSTMPVFTGSSFEMVQVPVGALLLVLCGLCTSVMWGGIFNMAVEGLGKYTAAASGIFMMFVVGGGILPLLQNWIADLTTYMTSYWVSIACLAFILFYAVAGSRNVNKDIPVE